MNLSIVKARFRERQVMKGKSTLEVGYGIGFVKWKHRSKNATIVTSDMLVGI